MIYGGEVQRAQQPRGSIRRDIACRETTHRLRILVETCWAEWKRCELLDRGRKCEEADSLAISGDATDREVR